MSRVTYACARCFRQKRKCDSRSPACTRCLQAGVECVGLDRVTAAPIPRSAVQYLEQSIAVLEPQFHQLIQDGETSQAATPTDPTISARKQVFMHLSRLAEDVAEPNHLMDDSIGKLRREMLSSPSNLPRIMVLPGTVDLQENSRLDAMSGNGHDEQADIEADHAQLNLHSIEGIPKQVADVLVRVYIDRILPQYPFYFSSQVQVHHDTVYKRRASLESPIPSISICVNALVMAISTMTSKSGTINKPFALADNLFRLAMNEYEKLPSNSLETLQCTMLICQFANFRPGTANIWRAKETAMRIAISLGLHREPDPGWYTVDQENANLRAHIFWVLYSMDRSISIATFRPLDIRDEYIDVKFPEASEELQLDNVDEAARRRRQQWLNHVRLRQLESEVYDMNFGKREIEHGSYQDWMAEMHERLLSWRQAAIALISSGPDWFDFVMSTVQFYLHMPCPRNPTPAASSKRVCFDAATTFLYGYIGMMKNGFLKFDWHCAHQCYPVAMFILDDLHFFVEAFSKARVTHLLDHFSETFSMLAIRWHQCIDLANNFEARRSAAYFSLLVSNEESLKLSQFKPVNIVDERYEFMGGDELPANNNSNSEVGDSDINFDDTTYWGPLPDDFGAFLDIDWSFTNGFNDPMDFIS